MPSVSGFVGTWRYVGLLVLPLSCHSGSSGSHDGGLDYAMDGGGTGGAAVGGGSGGGVVLDAAEGDTTGNGQMQDAASADLAADVFSSDGSLKDRVTGDGGWNTNGCGLMIDIGTLPGDNTSEPIALNNNGTVVGTSGIPAAFTGFSWKAGIVQPLGFQHQTSDPAERGISTPEALNDAGQVVGHASVSTVENTVASILADQPAGWLTGGGPTWLGTLGAYQGSATAINGAGLIIGQATVCSDTTVCKGSPKRWHAFIWDPATSKMRDLGTLGPVPTTGAVVFEAVAYDINSRGDVVGDSMTTTGAYHAVLWEAGMIRDLGTLGGVTSHAEAIDDSGRVYGTSTVSGGSEHVFLWQAGVMTDILALSDRLAAGPKVTRRGQVVFKTFDTTYHSFFWKDGTMHDLGSLGSGGTEAQAINELDVVVGRSQTSAGDSHAFVWQNDVMKDLGTLGGSVSSAMSINNHGQVLGSSTTISGTRHAFLYDPNVCPGGG